MPDDSTAAVTAGGGPNTSTDSDVVDRGDEPPIITRTRVPPSAEEPSRPRATAGETDDQAERDDDPVYPHTRVP